ncbi:uncharacterized protein YlxW (UPF0749 family) [Salibacterium salarium]|uniref:DUF881 domain-containing protein n=1 Tax=Salibacterium salarium TaxID=284579 RepID=UPI0027880973|nr:DUF881 domain-containing protein [Salibacterium salarium]MDQ0299046.1 uncharacterized protein YlxW (UPF0749 family) [Salibacterium salarium]
MPNIWKVLFLLIAVCGGYLAIAQVPDASSINSTENRDTLELRQTIRDEQERRQELYARIRENENLIEEYNREQKNSTEFAMKQAVENLEEKAGLTEKEGEGVKITISASDDVSNQSIRPQLLRQLVNELNQFGAEELSIEGERILETTAFRDIGGVTHVNGKRLPDLPVQMKVMAEETDKLQNELIVSESMDYFSFENMELEVQVEDNIKIPAFDEVRRVRYMEVLEEER